MNLHCQDPATASQDAKEHHRIEARTLYESWFIPLPQTHGPVDQRCRLGKEALGSFLVYGLGPNEAPRRQVPEAGVGTPERKEEASP